ncbi:MAG TPA: hypothetical protein VFE24_03390 [Pirellulales bacterium]|jgi:Tfp pilus assembly protein PilN|nr:hypothetical protein [Pirellulales bacterium]
MLFSTTTTLIAILRDRMIRADFARGAVEPTLLVIRPRPDEEDPATLVASALSFDRRKVSKVLVLLNDLWTHTLEVPAVNVANMPEDEIRQMLNFDSEPLSGIAPFDASIAVVPLGRNKAASATALTSGNVTNQYWVTQVQTYVRDQIGEAVKAAGGKLIGVAHPCDTPLEPGMDGYAYRAPVEEPALRAWLGGWLQRVEDKGAAVPIVLPAARVFTQQQANRNAAIFAVLLMGVCAAHYYWSTAQIAKAKAEITASEKPAAQLKQLKQQETQVEKDIKSEKEKQEQLADDVKAAEATLSAQRRRLSELLKELTQATSDQWVLQKISGDGHELILNGTTMHPDHVDQLATELSSKLASLGWGVEPAEQQATNWTDSGGPWTFDLHIRDLQKPKSPVVRKPLLPAARTTVVKPPDAAAH